MYLFIMFQKVTHKTNTISYPLLVPENVQKSIKTSSKAVYDYFSRSLVQLLKSPLSKSPKFKIPKVTNIKTSNFLNFNTQKINFSSKNSKKT